MPYLTYIESDGIESPNPYGNNVAKPERGKAKISKFMFIITTWLFCKHTTQRYLINQLLL